MDLRGLIEERKQQGKLHRKRAREWRRYSEDFGEKCDLANKGYVGFEVIQRRGVEAVRFGWRGNMQNIWHVNIPQYDSGDPTAS